MIGSRKRADSFKDVMDLAVAYVKQETVEPLRGIGRFLGFGIAAMVFFGAASVLLLLAVLRALQNETGEHFTGSLTWVPYMLTFVVAVIIAAFAGWAIGATKRKAAKQKKAKR